MLLTFERKLFPGLLAEGPVLLLWAIVVAILLVAAGGCGTAHYKEQADEEVYGIIDSKWSKSFGEKANYKIGDVEPSPNDVLVEKVAPPSGVLNLAQAVAIATAYNREYQEQKEQLYLTVLSLTGERHKFARQWFGTIDADYKRDIDDESIKYTANTGFDQLLADGAVISADIAIDWIRFLTGDPSMSLSSVLSGTFTKPLLGSGRKNAQESLTQTERDTLYQIRSFSRYRKIFVVSIVTDYYGVLQKRNGVTNARNNYERVAESKRRLEAEAGVGQRPRFEVDQASQDLLKARDGLVRAQQEYEQVLDEFKIMLAFDTDVEVELDQNELRILENAGITEPNYTLQQATETGLTQRLDLATSSDNVEDAARKVIVVADELGADLSLIASAGDIHSSGETDFTRLQFHNGTYGLGLATSLPFDRKDERNKYRTALIKLMQSQRQHQQDIAEVKLGIREAYRKLKEQQERYLIQKNSLELAQKRVESTEMFLLTGRAQTRDLLDAQDDLLKAQDDLTEALVGHTTAKLNFFRDIGVLEVMPDGMWKQPSSINLEINYERTQQ